MGFSLLAAADFARSSDWILIARTHLDPRTIGDGPFEISVPRGWDYMAPGEGKRGHLFISPGRAQFLVDVLETRESGRPEDVLRQHMKHEVESGGEVEGPVDVEIGDWRGCEADFVYPKTHVRSRIMVLESAAGQEVIAIASCASRHFDLMQVIFDKMVQSIRLYPERPANIDALSFWQRVTRDPRDVEAALSLARFYRSEGNLRAAEQMLRLALGVRRGYAAAHDELAYLYATADGESRRPADAVEHAREAVHIEPGNARYHATLALALEASGDLDGALEAARAAAKLAPDDARYDDLVARLRAAARRRR